MMKNLLYIILAVVVVVAYIRYTERRSLFFPMKEMTETPARRSGQPDFGLAGGPAAINLPYEDVYFKTQDGVTLNGWFIPKEGARYTLLFCHGNAGNISHRLSKIEMLHHLGINIFIFDYRGYGKSAGRPSEKGLYRDADAAYGYLIETKGISKENIIAYGESLGGAVAVELASHKELKALIVEEAFTSVADVAKTIYPFLPKGVLSSKFDSVSKIKDIRAPKLIIHSRDDEIIPFRMGKMLFDAAAQPKEFAIIHGSHNTAYVDSGDEYLSIVKKFVDSL